MPREEDKPFYNSKAWEAARRNALASDKGLCRMCRDRGLVVEATEVDHIKPIAEGGDKTDPQNLQALCGPCHRKKTGIDRKSDAVGSCIHGYPVGMCCAIGVSCE